MASAAAGGAAGGKSAMSTAKKMAKTFAKSSETVKVVVRVRPLFGKEIEEKRQVACTVDEDSCEVSLKDPKGGEHDLPRKFTFDACFPATVTQRRVYDRTAASIVESVMEGFNGTIFAYGQTGAGKTHTMEGKADPPEMRGLMPNAFYHIFECVAANEDEEKQFLVRASYLEIYNEEIRDLLSRDPKNRLELKESVDTGVFVKDLTTAVVKSAAEIDAVLQSGKKNRSTGATLMNATSSRSHSIFTVTIETSSKGVDGKQHFRVGKLNMVDLAGSERQSKTGATGQRLKEATKINLSLSALGNVISALVDSKSKHIPYRDSKLTRLLYDSLGGNTKTCMIANCGPADYNYDETLSTLRYADRAKQIKNKPRINEDPKDAMLREYYQEIERLRAMLEQKAKQASSAPQVTIGGVAVPASGETAAAREAAQQAHAAAQATGLSDAERQRLEAEAAKKQKELETRAREEKEKLLQDKARTEEERAALAAQLEAQEKAQREAAYAKAQLQTQLESMYKKLIKGSEMMDLAAKQQEDLRRAQMELQERKRQEAKLSQELEEANIMMEEYYANMAEEVEAKRAKLKKLFGKWQSAKAEIRDLKEESQREKEDMLATIRELNRVIKLKQVLLDHFVPPQEVERLETRAQWDDEAEEWMVMGHKITGNSLRPRRPNLVPGARRAEAQFAAARRSFDPSARWRGEDPVQLQAEPALRTAAPYNPSMRERVALLGDSAGASSGAGAEG